MKGNAMVTFIIVVAAIAMLVNNWTLLQKGVSAAATPTSEVTSWDSLGASTVSTLKENLMMPIWLLVLIVGGIMILK